MNINIPEKYADLYLKALSQKKQMLEAKIQDFQQEINEIESHIRSLTSMSIFNDMPPDHSILKATAYRHEWSWTRKISYYEEIKQKLFTATEVVDFIMDNEKLLHKSKVRSSISAALSNNHRSGKYLKYSDPETGKMYYGPRKWFIEEGHPRHNFLPDFLTTRLPIK